MWDFTVLWKMLLFYFLMGIALWIFAGKGSALMSFQQCQEAPEVKVGKDTCWYLPFPDDSALI